LIRTGNLGPPSKRRLF